VPDGQFTGSIDIDGDEKDVAGSEYVVLEENVDSVCIHVPSDCAVVPDGQFTGAI
jgi:hypothetical protein